MPPSRIDETRAFVPVHIALMTVSDTRDASNDTSGDTLESRIKEAGHILAARLIVKDERAQIAAQLRHWIADPEIDVVISTGGTGLTGRDVTVEAFRSVFEKEIDGFSVLFHQISYEKVDKLKGMNVTIVTTAANDNQARSLLKHMGMPFRA